MAKKKVRGRFTIKLNEHDPAHEAAICLLESQPPRGKAQFIVNAVLRYANDPAIPAETSPPAMSRAMIEAIVLEVLHKQQSDQQDGAGMQEQDPIQTGTVQPAAMEKSAMPIEPAQADPRTVSLIVDTLSAFRGG